jgi:probable HAF family extracellular repeat protein
MVAQHRQGAAGLCAFVLRKQARGLFQGLAIRCRPKGGRTLSNRKSSWLAAASVVVALLWMAGSVGQAGTITVYTATDLGTLGGSSASALAINDSEQVVGSSSTGTSTGAFLYSSSTGMTNLGTLTLGVASYAYGININGQVVGDSGNYAFLYSSSSSPKMSSLGSLGGGYSQAAGINDSGQIVGESYTTGFTALDVFLYNSNSTKPQMTSLGTLGGYAGYAAGINNNGQIVGNSYIAGNTADHAFLYNSASSSAKMLDLGTMGGASSYAYAINNEGQIVGYSDTASGASHAFLYTYSLSSPTLTAADDLGTLGGATSSALAINNDAQVEVVGYSLTSSGAMDAFLYTGTTMEDLVTTMGSPLKGWTNTEATGINDAGDIVGYGTYKGATQAFLLTPEQVEQQPPATTPEPITMIFFGTGLVAVGGYVAKRRMLRQG